MNVENFFSFNKIIILNLYMVASRCSTAMWSVVGVVVALGTVVVLRTVVV